MLVGFNDPDIKAFQDELEKHGWSEGRNIHIDYRVAPAGTQAQTLAKELVATQPEVIFALSRPATAALQKETHQRLPAISVHRQFVLDGGLMAYGPDTADIFRRSATYIDRILKGEKPAELPVQQPNKFEFVINLKTAQSFGLTVPRILLSTADEVIE